MQQHLATLACLLTVLFAGCTSLGDDVDTITVQYSGCWSGNVGDLESSTSVDGCGDRSFDATPGTINSAVFQKDDGSSGELCVILLYQDKEVKRQCTTAEYGVVTISN